MITVGPTLSPLLRHRGTSVQGAVRAAGMDVGVSQQLSGAASTAPPLDPVADLIHKCSEDAAELDRMQCQGRVGPKEYIVGIVNVAVAEGTVGMIKGVEGMCDEATVRDADIRRRARSRESWPFSAAYAGSGRPCGSDDADLPHQDGGRTALVSSLSSASHGARGAHAMVVRIGISTSAFVTHLAMSASCALARPATLGQRRLPPAITGVPSVHRGLTVVASAMQLRQALARMREHMTRTATPWTISRIRSSL